MSHRLFALCLSLSLLLFGCTQKPPPEPLATDFVCDFRAQYNGLTAVGTLTRRTAGTLQLSFSEPETLNGLSAEWDGEKVTLLYKGLSYSVAPDALPESALGESLLAAFDAALRGEGDRQETDKNITVNGLSANTAFTFVYDAESGAPLSLSIPSLPLTVTFKNAQAQ